MDNRCANRMSVRVRCCGIGPYEIVEKLVRACRYTDEYAGLVSTGATVNICLSVEVAAGGAQHEIEQALQIVGAVEGEAHGAFAVAGLLDGYIGLEASA